MKCLIVIAGFIVLGLLNPVRTTNHDTPKSTQHISIKDAALHKKIAAAPVTPPVSQPASAPVTPVSTPVPVAAPAAAVSAPTAPQPIQEPTGCAVYLPLVEQYNWPVATMMAIMQAESSCNPQAYNPSGCYGLFQLYNEDITDPAGNVAAAYQIYLRQGLGAWSTYTSGAYLNYE